MTLVRQLGVVVAGIVFSYLAGALCGYVFYIYRIPDQWPHAGPILARYLFDPGIAILTGALVGALAKCRPAVLAACSLVPYELLTLSGGKLQGGRFLLTASLGVLSLLLAAVAASAIFRMRVRSPESGIA